MTFKRIFEFFKNKHKVRFKKGYVVTPSNENIPSLEAAQAIMAECSPCGCNGCNGVRSDLNPETGELVGSYFTGPMGGPYIMVTEPLADAHKNANALVKAR